VLCRHTRSLGLHAELESQTKEASFSGLGISHATQRPEALSGLP